MATLIRATENVYAPDVLGVRRLVAAAGDAYDPATIAIVGIVTLADPPAAGLVPLEGYDALTEAQVLELLPTMAVEQLAAVQAYERAHLARGAISRYGRRSEILTSGRVAAKDAPSVSLSGGYDAMGPAELDAEIQRRGLDVVGTGSGGNVLKKDKVAALQAHDAKTEAGPPPPPPADVDE